MHKALLLVPGLLLAALSPAGAGGTIPPEPRVIYADPDPAADHGIHPMPHHPHVIGEAMLVAGAEPVARYWVDQGPHYSGPAVVDFPRPVFHGGQPLRDFPYVRTWEAAYGYPAAAPASRHRPHRYHRGYHRAVPYVTK